MSFLRDLVRAKHDLWEHGWTSMGGGGNLGLEGPSRRTAAGEPVDQARALTLSAYWAALRNIAQDVAKLPRQLRKRRETRGSDLVRAHPAYQLIAKRPNPRQTGFQFVQLMQWRALGWGNAYAEIVRRGPNNTGPVAEVWPVHPSKVTPVPTADGKGVIYQWRQKPGQKPLEFTSADMFHLRGVGGDLEGMSLVQAGAEVLGLGLAAQRNAGRFFHEGMAKRPVVFTKTTLSAAGRKALRQRILEDKKEDAEGRRKIPIIEGDYNLGDMGIPPEDAQLLETRMFTSEEIARLVRIACEKIQHYRNAKGWASLELLDTNHANDTLAPWVVTWQEECDLKLLEEDEREDHFFKFMLQGLMRGDTAARVAYYNSGLEKGWLSRNDVRDLEDMNPIEGQGGDEYMVQAQMTPLDKAGAAAVQPKPPAPPAGGREDESDEEPEQEEREPKDDKKKRRALARAALRPLLKDAARRLADFEQNALQRALAKHAANTPALCTWASEFYSTLAKRATEELRPILAAAATMLDAPAVPAQELAGSWLHLPQTTAGYVAYCGLAAKCEPGARAAALVLAVETAHFGDEHA